MLLMPSFCIRKSKRMKKITQGSSFWGSPQSLDLAFNPQPPKNANQRFSRMFQFQPFFGHSLLLFEIKTKFIKLCTNFQIKQTTFFPSKCNSLLLCRKPVHQNCLHFFKNFKKIVRALRVKMFIYCVFRNLISLLTCHLYQIC